MCFNCTVSAVFQQYIMQANKVFKSKWLKFASAFCALAITVFEKKQPVSVSSTASAYARLLKIRSFNNRDCILQGSKMRKHLDRRRQHNQDFR